MIQQTIDWTDINVIVNLLICVLFGTLLLFFVYQTQRYKRKAPQFMISLAFGTLGGFVAFIAEAGLGGLFFPNNSYLLATQLSFYALQIFFFYIFLENLNSMKINTKRFAIIFGFAFLQILSLWLIVWFQSSGITGDLWLLADFGYNMLALSVYGVFGMWTYFRTYKYTKEGRPLIMMIALLIVSLGFLLLSINDYTSYFHVSPEWMADLMILGDIFPSIGLFMFLLSYITNVDYIYRLPNDNFMLMVSYKSGITIHSVNFKTVKEIVVEEHLVSGLLTSISMIFSNVLHSQKYIETISSKDAEILMKQGKYVFVTILTEKITAILNNALQRYLNEFEAKYEELLKNGSSEVTAFADAESLLKPIFPFLVVADNSKKTASVNPEDRK